MGQVMDTNLRGSFHDARGRKVMMGSAAVASFNIRSTAGVMGHAAAGELLGRQGRGHRSHQGGARGGALEHLGERGAPRA